MNPPKFLSVPHIMVDYRDNVVQQISPNSSSCLTGTLCSLICNSPDPLPSALGSHHIFSFLSSNIFSCSEFDIQKKLNVMTNYYGVHISYRLILKLELNSHLFFFL